MGEGSGNSPSSTPFRYQAIQVSPKKVRRTIFPQQRTYILQKKKIKNYQQNLKRLKIRIYKNLINIYKYPLSGFKIFIAKIRPPFIYFDNCVCTRHAFISFNVISVLHEVTLYIIAFSKHTMPTNEKNIPKSINSKFPNQSLFNIQCTH